MEPVPQAPISPTSLQTEVPQAPITDKVCPFCHIALKDDYYFCPNCGKKLKDPPMTAAKEIGIYLLSVLLPPLGLWPGIRYILSGNAKTRRVGWIAVGLTVLATIITIWLFMGFMNGLTQGLNSSLNQYQSLGGY